MLYLKHFFNLNLKFKLECRDTIFFIIYSYFQSKTLNTFSANQARTMRGYTIINVKLIEMKMKHIVLYVL